MEKAVFFPGRNVGYRTQLVAFLLTPIKPCGRDQFEVFFGRWVIPCGDENAAKGSRASFPSRAEFYRGMMLVRGVRKSHFPLERGANPCSSVLSPSHLLQHHPKVASWILSHHPTPSLSSQVLPSSLAAGWERKSH